MHMKGEYNMAVSTKKKANVPERYVCSKCGRSIRWMTKPLAQTTGKCPKAMNGNHSWIKG